MTENSFKTVKFHLRLYIFGQVFHQIRIDLCLPEGKQHQKSKDKSQGNYLFPVTYEIVFSSHCFSGYPGLFRLALFELIFIYIIGGRLLNCLKCHPDACKKSPKHLSCHIVNRIIRAVHQMSTCRNLHTVSCIPFNFRPDKILFRCNVV